MYRPVTLVLFLCLFIAVSFAQVSSKAGNCPLTSSVTICTPRCTSDFQCSLNQKCCPNRCGSKSCVSPSPFSTGDNGYKGNTGSTVYCAGVKCGPYEKCVFDRKTKREKCTRT